MLLPNRDIFPYWVRMKMDTSISDMAMFNPISPSQESLISCEWGEHICAS